MRNRLFAQAMAEGLREGEEIDLDVSHLIAMHQISWLCHASLYR
jgi:hypothetical protein